MLEYEFKFGRNMLFESSVLMENWLSDAWDWTADKVKSAGSWMVDKVKDFGGTAVKAAKDLMSKKDEKEKQNDESVSELEKKINQLQQYISTQWQ